MSTLDPEVEPIVAPMDAANAAMIAHVRPPGWINPAPRHCDLLVVGGGPAGLVAAVGAAGLGARVALVERHLLGGDCLVSGCVPSKAILRAARAVHDVAQARRFGVDAEPRVDFGRVMERLRTERAKIAHHDAAERFRGLGIDVHFGEGRFVGRRELEVGGQRIAFSRALIATGASPAVPPIPGLDPARVLTSESVWSLTELPQRLVVIGGGPIGCELAQSFRRLGAEVDLVAASERLLPRDEPDAAEVLAEALASEGVRLHLGATVAHVAHGALHRLRVEGGAGAVDLEADAILLAAGRAPNVGALDLDAAGVAFTPRGVRVDDLLRTTNPRIYAAGDVASAWQFTHAADALARIVVQNALFFGRKRASALVVPWVTYTDPEVAHVGLTLDEARRAGHDPLVLREALAGNDRAVVDGADQGFAQLLVGRGGRLIGATIVGRDAGDAIGELALAMTAGLRASDLSATIHPYPTRSEIWKRLGDRYQRTRLTPTAARVLRAVLALRVRT